MKNDRLNKTLTFRTGKDIAKLLKSSQYRPSNLDFSLPTTETQSVLCTIWNTVLGHNDFGVNEDFFRIGGNSLKAVQVVSRIAKQFSVQINLTDVFLQPTITQLAAHILSLQKNLLSSSAIEIIARPEHLPLSFSQERLWFIDQLEGSVQYHLPYVLRLKGNLHKEAMDYALQTFVNRHEILRTVIRSHNGQGYQFIKDKNTWELSLIEGSQYANKPQELKKFVATLIRKPFDLSKDHLLRATLIKLTEQESIFVATLHHIASDGWSKSIFVKELVELYNTYREGNLVDLPPLKLQYADYAIWQRKHYQSDWFSNKLSYWKSKLEGISALDLPLDYVRPPVQSTNGTKIHFTIGKELLAALQQLSNQQGLTLFMTLLSGFKVLLHRYSGQEDIGVGTPIANRTRKEVEELVGFFVNTLVLRSNVNSDTGFIEFLQQVKTTALEAYEHQEVPFEKVVEAVVKERDPSRNPLFQVMFILQNVPTLPDLGLADVQVSREDYEPNTSQFDLTFIIMENADELKASVEYCTDLFSEQTIVRMIGHYKELLNSIVQQPNQKIGLLPMLSKAEEHQLLVEFNNTVIEYPGDKTIVDLFEEQAARTPEATAIVFGEEKLTYKELNERANQLGHYLRSKGVKEESFIPICIERSFEMVIGILGILKAGAAYVPIDTEYPLERIRYILKDTGAKILITNTNFASSFPAGEIDELICLDNYEVPSTSAKLTRNFAQNSIACIIYTSGSSGKPKGVKLSNDGLVNRLYWMWHTYPFELDERNAIKTPIGFVDHICELFGALNQGVTSVIFRKEELLDLDVLVEKLGEQKITRWVLVPSLLKMLLNKLQNDSINLPHLKYWNSSGETLPMDLVADFYKVFPSTSHKLLNIYGSTEVSADVSCYDTSMDVSKKANKSHRHIPIGKPISNTKMYIVNKHENLVAQGVKGEICIAGLQVAQGYLNLPELTSERFTKDPFNVRSGSYMFRTGDIGCWLSDGNIEYQGRRDDQVKIRGYRIELGEIEINLQQCKGVTQGVVLAKEDNSGRRLVGYVVTEGIINKEAIITELKSKLPGYMVPALWIQLQVMPLTTNGKIDRKALPDPDANELLRKEYLAPRNEVEKKLLAIWEDLLGIEKIGIHDNFFHLGGHSLLAMRVVSEIRKELKVELSIKDLFFHYTIAALAAELSVSGKNNLLLPSIEAVSPRPEYLPLSFGQERFWFLHQLNSNVRYHIDYVIRLKGNLHSDAMDYALQTLVNRHEILRTVIRSHNGEGYQFIKDKNTWQLTRIEGSQYVSKPEDLKKLVTSLIRKPFDLSNDDVLRATLIKLTDQESIFVAALHHIASDGWSRSIIVKELVELYNSHLEGNVKDLTPLKLQYADYVIWQRKHFHGDWFNNKLSYWKNKLEGISALELPLDYVRPPVQSTNGAEINFTIDKELLAGLQHLSHQQGVTLFMTLLSGFNVLLHRYSGQEDISVGTPIANRTRKEVEELVGFFVNTVVLRSEVNSDTGFIEFLQQVKATTLEAYEHQEVSFEKVVEAIVKKRDPSRNPLFQAMFVLQNIPPISHLSLTDVQVSREHYEPNTSQYDLAFTISEIAVGLKASVEYCTDLFSEQTIVRMIGHYKELLSSIVKQPNQKIGLLPMLSKAEEHQLLVEFNNTVIDYPRDKTIVDLFEEQAASTPEATAMVFEEEKLTYKELNERANQLGHYLRSKGVKEESLIPICIESSFEMVIGILGILKAGAAYVPIDMEYPLERIRYILEDTAASVAISSKKSGLKIETEKGLYIIKLDENLTELEEQPASEVPTSLSPRNLCYVIYTSGSTGLPKGVLIEHRSLLNYAILFQKHFSINSDDCILQLNSISFDTSIEDIFPALISGGSIRLIESAGKGLDAIKNHIEEKNVTLISASPGLIDFLNKELRNFGKLKCIISGGDILYPNFINNLLQKVKIVNTYGPTETTVAVAYHHIKKTEDASLLGKQVGNGALYILDKNNQLCPIGMGGEICISGCGVARGYLNREDLTREKFVNNPFGKGDAKMYRTGDFGRWQNEGNIEFLGRKDEQVKVRGYRIELGEIEAVIQQSNLVKQAVVRAKKDTTGNSGLVGYIVPDGSLNLNTLKAYLKNKLPEYMIPTMWVELEALPLTPNGKIDKKSLPDFDAGKILNENYVAPRDETERTLAEIWEKVLEIEKVGIYNNFFELGGHSLMILKLASQVRKLGLQIDVKDFFEYQTIEQQSHFIKTSLQLLNTASEGKFVIPIQPQGNNTPMFAFPEFLLYSKIGKHISKKQPFYSLEHSPYKTVESVVNHYLTEIKKIYSRGPYFLTGYCNWGKIAVELAQTLIAQGDEVPVLVLIEYYNPKIKISRFSSKFIRNKTQFIIKKLRDNASFVNKRKFLSKEFVYALRYINKRITRAMLKKRVLIQKKYSGKVVLFQASETYGYKNDSHMGWSEIFTGEVKKFVIKGEHLGLMIDYDSTAQIAEILNTELLNVNADQ